MDPMLLVSLSGAACLGVGFLLAATAFVAWRMRLRRRRAESGAKVQQLTERAAGQLGVSEHAPGVWEGTVQGRRVRWNLRDVEYDTGPRQQLALGTPVPTAQLGLTHRPLIYGAEPPQHELPMVRLGDAGFDVRFFIHADLEHLSLLQPDVRAALMAAADDAQLRIRNGWLWIDHVATPELVARLSQRHDALFAAARALEGVSGEVEVRVRKLSQDPVAKVRCTVLDLLIARGASEFTTWIARPLLSDEDIHVRARAAEITHDVELLSALVQDKAAPVEVRLRAASALAQVAGPAERLKAAEALAKGEGALAQMAVELCSGLGADAENVLIELVSTQTGTVARQAVAQLGVVGSARSLVVLQSLCDAPEQSLVLRTEAKTVLDAIRSKANRRSRPASTPPAHATPVTGSGRAYHPSSPPGSPSHGGPSQGSRASQVVRSSPPEARASRASNSGAKQVRVSSGRGSGEAGGR